MPPDLITTELGRAGFGGVLLLGDHEGRALDADEDESVIVVATKVVG
jgi:hypothetical protein